LYAAVQGHKPAFLILQVFVNDSPMWSIALSTMVTSPRNSARLHRISSVGTAVLDGVGVGAGDGVELGGSVDVGGLVFVAVAVGGFVELGRGVGLGAGVRVNVGADVAEGAAVWVGVGGTLAVAVG
jgi:hypothetical protein